MGTELESTIRKLKYEIAKRKKELIGISDPLHKLQLELEIKDYQSEIQLEQDLWLESERELDGTGLDELMGIK